MSSKKRSRSSSISKIDYIKKNKEEAIKPRRSSHTSTPIPKLKSKSLINSPSNSQRTNSNKILSQTQPSEMMNENKMKDGSDIKHNLADILEDEKSLESESQISRLSLYQNQLVSARQSLGVAADGLREDMKTENEIDHHFHVENTPLQIPTPPNHDPSSIQYNPEISASDTSSSELSVVVTPLKSLDPIFRNADYSGMSINEQIKRSARRIRILETGEEVEDTT